MWSWQQAAVTSTLTLIVGVILYVFGQWISKFVIEPVYEQRKIIGEIADALIYYANVAPFENSSTKERVPEASANLRKLATSLMATTYLIPAYGFLSRRDWVRKIEDINIASRCLILLSNSVYGNVSFNK